MLTRSGYFTTASCSHFMPSEQFMRKLRSAALDAGNVPETDYLKFYLFQVV